MEKVRILDYTPAYGDDFKRISYAWIEQYFGIEDQDRQLLENHKAEIIDKGGVILFAEYDGKIAGSCALIKYSDAFYELAKMGVMPEYQGLKLGRKLAEAVIARARDLGAQKVFLESSSQLKAALALYEKLGFRPDPDLDISPFSRCNLQLALTL
ncbi:MAG: hypothetical protein Roseis2KO_51400 [Roseivirga sp.]